MKILATGDWHIGELNGPVKNNENARMQDTLNCVNFLIDKAEEEQPDISIIAGDLFNKSKLWGEQTLKETNIAIELLRRLHKVAPVVLLFGTENHDNKRAFELIKKAMPDLHIITEPRLVTVNTKSGPVQVAGIPGFDKGYFRTKFPGMAKEEENKICSQMLGDIVLGLSAQLQPNIPSVLTAHYSVAGCETESGMHIFMQNDVVLPTEALEASDFDLVCLGHIHKAQQLDTNKPVYYCGSVNGLTFNEEDQDKGFWMHEFSKVEFGSGSISIRDKQFIKTPSREFKTLGLTVERLKGFVNDGDDLFGGDFQDKIVRVHYEADEDTEKQLNKKQLEKRLLDQGAFWVSEIRPVRIHQTTTKEGLTENSDPLSNLKNWLEAEGIEQVEEILELARPMIEKVSAKMPSGKLNGTFEPQRLKVTNYRSYKEEKFDFTQVQFATVNGPNGTGKSAFFMDAVCDCLFEEPREGELTGWITNGQKSGMMEFEFKLDTNWKVIRTRTRSGKVTLALQQFVNDEWVDRSGTKKDDTQKKIVDLLGMDSQTFRIVCTVMQDGYGLFMESCKESRMQVLGNILGLSIYEKLEKETVELRKEANREVKNLKEQIANFDETLKEKNLLNENLVRLLGQKNELTGDLSIKEGDLKKTQELIAGLKSLEEQATKTKNYIRDIETEIQGKKDEIQSINAKSDKANKMMTQEHVVLEKANIYDQVKEKVTVLKTKQPRLAEISKVSKDNQLERAKLDTEANKLNKQKAELEKVLVKRAEIDKAAIEYKANQETLEKLDKKFEVFNEVEKKLGEITVREWQINSEIENLKSKLKAELERINKQIEYLQNSGCIDVEKANCSFLQEAKKDREKLDSVKAELEGLEVNVELEQVKENKAKLEKQLEELGYNKEFHKSIKDKVAALKPMADMLPGLEGKQELLKNINSQIVQINNQIKNLNAKTEEIKAEYTALNNELAQLPQLELTLKNLEGWVKAKEQLPAAKQYLQQATETVVKLTNEIASKEQQKEKLEDEYKQLVAKTENLEKYIAEEKALRDHIFYIRSDLDGINTDIGGVKERLNTLTEAEKQQKELKKQLQPTARKANHYDILKKACSIDGIPFSIVRTVVPELSQIANAILTQMTGGKMTLEIKLDKIQKNGNEVNALEIWITHYERGTMPYLSFSGGQKVRAALSGAFALSELKSSRGNIKSNMFFVDEPSFLDGEGVDAYCDALEILAQKNMRVVAISHDPQMQSRFPQRILVNSIEGQGSKIQFIA